MNCETCLESIALGLYGELSADERRALDAHLASCEACREAERAYAATVTLLRRASPEVPSRPAAPRPRISRAWRAAAAAVLLAGIAALVAETARPRRPEPHEPAVVEAPPRPMVTDTSAETRLAAIERDGRGALGVLDEDFLAGLTASPDPSLAARAAVLLGRRGTPRAEWALRAALARPVTRAPAFDALAALGRLDALRDAAPALADPALRRRAAEVLLARGTTEAFQALLVHAAKGDRACLAACRAFRAEAALPTLQAALSDEARRAVAVDLLLTADGDTYREALLDAARSDEALRDEAIEQARSTPSGARFLVLALCDGLLRPAATAALASAPVREVRGALAEALRDEVRRGAAVAFLASRSDEAASRDLLVSALVHADVRATAGAALFARGDVRAVGPILRGGEPEDLLALSVLDAEKRRRELARALRSSSTRVAALRAIRRGDAALWRDVLPLLRDDRVRQEALAALARTGVDGAVPYLIPYVSTSEEGRVARSGLVSIVGEDFGEDPRDWKAWWRSQTN